MELVVYLTAAVLSIVVNAINLAPRVRQIWRAIANNTYGHHDSARSLQAGPEGDAQGAAGRGRGRGQEARAGGVTLRRIVSEDGYTDLFADEQGRFALIEYDTVGRELIEGFGSIDEQHGPTVLKDARTGTDARAGAAFSQPRQVDRVRRRCRC